MKVKLKEVCSKNKGWSIYELGKLLLDHEGISIGTVYAWGNGSRTPRAKHLDLLCNVLDCTLSDIYEVEPYTFKSETMKAIAERGRN